VVFDPVEPAEPVVSASANGIDTTAEPTPNATARAPTRPMNRLYGKTAEVIDRAESLDVTGVP